MAMIGETRTGPSPNGDLVNRVQQLRLDNHLATGTGSRNRAVLLPWILCGLMAVTWVFLGVRVYRASGQRIENLPANGVAPGAAPTTQGPQPGTSSPPVAHAASRGVSPLLAPGALVTQLRGNVIPSLQITISPIDVAGELVEIYFKEGDTVRKGTTLGRLRSTRYLNDLNRATAAVAVAEARLADLRPDAVRQAELAQMEADLKEAEANLQRARDELKRQEDQVLRGSAASQALEQARADVAAWTARVEKMKAGLELLKMGARDTRIREAEAAVRDAIAVRDEAQRLYDNCTILAPIDGTILTKSADKGALVSPMSFNVASGICSMADLSKLEVEIDVPERQITRIQVGQLCVIQADADPNRSYRGVVDRIMPIADDTKNVVKVRIRVYLHKDTGEKPGSFLKPKMGVTATVYNQPFEFDLAKDLAWGDEPNLSLTKVGQVIRP